MKTLLSITTLLFISTIGFSQNHGAIKYTENIKLDFDLPDGVELSEMMGNSITTNKELFFHDNVSVYKDAKNNENSDLEMSNDDGSFQIKIKRDDTENIYYTNLKEKLSLQQTGFMGKEFLIHNTLERPKWKITGDRIKYLGYVCQKATMTEKGREKDEAGQYKDREVVAWFTTDIPFSIGPDNYNQLPGAILMISVDEGKTEIKAIEVSLSMPDKTNMTKPDKGQKVTPEEYAKIVEEKTKEMEKMNGGRHIMIRG